MVCCPSEIADTPTKHHPGAREALSEITIGKKMREKRSVAVSSVVAAIFLTCIKLIVGFLTGSLGILAEAAHSALDLAAAFITLFAVRLSDRPADESHLYGHGKVENLSALAETLLLLATCLWIVYEAIQRLFFIAVEVDPNLWAFLVMGISIGIDYSRSRALSRVAKKYRSQALEADALHFSTDIWSSTVVILGLAFVRFGDYWGGDRTVFQNADAIAALVVAVIVMYVSIRLGRRAIDVLLDRAPAGLAGRISRAIEKVAGIQRVSRIRLRDVGNQLFVDLKVDVPRHLSLEESHLVTQNAQAVVHAISPGADVVIHAVPVIESEGILEKIQAVAVREHVSVHNVTTHWTDRGLWIDLDIEVDSNISLEYAHRQATNLEIKLRAELIGTRAFASVAGINAHIEPRAKEPLIGTPLETDEANSYAEQIRKIGRTLKGAGDCRKIELHKMSGKVYLSLCLPVDAQISIAEAHGISEEMENRLRRQFPELGRVVIHTEPAG
jgi:cation diffusion facilitator family transporter